METNFDGHADFVLDFCDGEWPEDPPEVDEDEGKGDLLASWSYATGWANALGKTVPQLLSEREEAVVEGDDA